MLAFVYFFFYQNHFIDECARKKKAKIPESQSFRDQSFFVRYRRICVLNKSKTSTERGLYQICFFGIFVWTVVRSPGMTEMALLEKVIGQYVYYEVYTRL